MARNARLATKVREFSAPSAATRPLPEDLGPPEGRGPEEVVPAPTLAGEVAPVRPELVDETPQAAHRPGSYSDPSLLQEEAGIGPVATEGLGRRIGVGVADDRCPPVFP